MTREVYTGNSDPYLHLSAAQADPEGLVVTHWLYNKSDRPLLNVTVNGRLMSHRLLPGESTSWYSRDFVELDGIGYAVFTIEMDVPRRKRKWWWR